MLNREKLHEKLQEHDFDKEARKESNGRRRMRLLALAHLKEGKGYSDTARALRTSRVSVMRWAKWFMNGGMERVAGITHSWTCSKLPKWQDEALCVAVEKLQAEREGGRIRAEDIRVLLREQFHIEYTPTGVYRLLKRLKMVWITVRSIHPDADPAAQEEFKKKFWEKVEEILPEGVAKEQVDIWFEDEARVGQRTTLTRIWARKGTRPRVVRQAQSESAYIFGAFCAQRDCAIGLVMPEANTEAMAHELNAISEVVPQGRHAVVVCDRASWHMTPKLPTLANVSLLPLPPVSPELNPAERVWEHLRDTDLANRCYDCYDHIVDVCCEAWNKFTNIPSLIHSICFRQWASQGSPPVTI
jgi:transposase